MAMARGGEKIWIELFDGDGEPDWGARTARRDLDRLFLGMQRTPATTATLHRQTKAMMKT